MSIETRKLLETFTFAFSGLVVAFAMAWVLLALVNFSYPFWHDHAGMDEAIELYGGQNRYRTGFDQTTPEQRYELFAGINRAIHRSGRGLAELSYKVPGEPEQNLLREPEIVHLQDVAALIDIGKYAAGVLFGVWLATIVYFGVTGRAVPRLRHQVAGILILVAAIGLLVLVLGPTEVFYAMHEWVFPPGHEWFFYYQDSLMSTMMHAPQLFGYIAAEWLLLALICFVFLQLTAKRGCAVLRSRFAGDANAS